MFNSKSLYISGGTFTDHNHSYGLAAGQGAPLPHFHSDQTDIWSICQLDLKPDKVGRSKRLLRLWSSIRRTSMPREHPGRCPREDWRLGRPHH